MFLGRDLVLFYSCERLPHQLTQPSQTVNMGIHKLMWNKYEILTLFSLSNSFNLLSHALLETPCLCVSVSVPSLQGGLLINHHADQSLNSFCQWQSALVGKNGQRHDHAILLTGFDICSWKNEPCDTLGTTPKHGLGNLGVSTAGAELVSNKRVHFCTLLVLFVSLLEEDRTVLFLDCHLFREYF